jgi:hypothetical protein
MLLSAACLLGSASIAKIQGYTGQVVTFGTASALAIVAAFCGWMDRRG